MAFNVVFMPQVLNDVQDAVDWYNKSQKGVGSRFFSVLKTHYKLLRKDPYCVAIKYDEIRCLPVSKFPYNIHYKIEQDDNTVVIFAVYHTSRSPEIWNKRI